MEQIIRNHYRAKLKDGITKEDVKKAIALDRHISLKEHSRIEKEKKGLLTEGIFIYKDMLFIYTETVDEEIKPTFLFPTLSNLLWLWPCENENTPFAKMNLVFYFAIPEGLDDFTRKTPPLARAGRIAFLKPETMFDYVYTHTALVKEGAIMGEKWQSIALHENILFSYYEEPRLKEINVKRNPELKSEVINEWLSMDPAAHFLRIDPEKDFLVIECLESIG